MTQASRVTGIKEFDRVLNQLESSVARKVVRSSTNAGLTVMSKAIRKEIDAEPDISPQLRRALKRTIGRRFAKQRGNKNRLTAKAGFGVAKKKATVQRSGKNKSGVGISRANAHWFALGTGERLVGLRTRRTKTGKTKVRTKNAVRYAGKITQVRAVQRAVANFGRYALAAMAGTAREKLAIELAQLSQQK